MIVAILGFIKPQYFSRRLIGRLLSHDRVKNCVIDLTILNIENL